MKRALFTIGYEGRSAEDLVNLLQQNGVKILLDARRRANSRKKGLSKKALGALCEKRHIRYVHEVDLGTPPNHMEQVKAKGGYDNSILEEFRKYLLTQDEAMDRAVGLATDGATCVLCYEADARNCHRLIVAEEICKRTGFELKHL